MASSMQARLLLLYHNPARSRCGGTVMQSVLHTAHRKPQSASTDRPDRKVRIVSPEANWGVLVVI